MKTLFVFMGWASFPEMYEYLFENSNVIYINPVRYKKEDILNIPKKDRIFFGWSLGTIEILKLIDIGIYPERLILITPTNDFTKNIKTIILKKMISEISKNKNKVLNDFYKNSFYSIEKYEEFREEYSNQIEGLDSEELILGLKYLLNEKVDLINEIENECLIFLASEDKIIRNRNSRQILENIKKPIIYKFKSCGHNIIYENQLKLKDRVRKFIDDR